MFKPTNNQKDEKDLFQRQILTLQHYKNYLKLDLLFMLTLILIMGISFSVWYFIPMGIVAWFMKNHFFEYRFNRAMALMLEQSSSFNIPENDSQRINNFW